MENGDVVEDFELADAAGQMRKLSEFLQLGPVVLFCFPLAMSKGCTAESCYFRDLAAEFAEFKAARIGLSADSVARQALFSEKHGFDFPLLSDPEGKVTSMLGVKRNVPFLPVRRWTFVIDSDRVILEVIKSEVSMHHHADRALEVLRARATSPS
jgi:peroxiredoxin Q/BCP